jgi:hypothetical protein
VSRTGKADGEKVPGTIDKQTAAFTPIIMPCQYFCGWIESKFLSRKN